MHKVLISFMFSTIAAIALTVIVVLLFSPQYIIDSINDERASYEKVLGSENVEKAVLMTDDVFTGLNPAIRFTEKYFIIEEDQMMSNLNENNPGVGNSASWFRIKLQEAHDTGWNVIYQTLQRLSFFVILLPLFLFIAIPAIVHGLSEREIKKQSLGYTSPLRYNLSFLGFLSLLFLAVVLLFLPINVTIEFLFLWIIVAAYLLKTVTSHLLKRF